MFYFLILDYTQSFFLSKKDKKKYKTSLDRIRTGDPWLIRPVL